MEIKNLENLYGLKDIADKNLQNTNASTNTTGSIFNLMSSCIEKADTSGDGTLSEEEISVFLNKGCDEAISEFKEELEASGEEIDDSFIDQIKKMIGEMLHSYNEAKENVSELDGMKREDFIKNATDAQNSENAPMFWQVIGMDNAEGIFDTFDSDGDGTLSTEELEAISGLDGDKNSVSLQDLGNFFNSQENEIGIETTQEIQETTNTQTQNSSSPSVGSTNNSFTPQTIENGNKERTIEVINKEIADQEALKETTKANAETAIAEQDELIANALEQSDLSEEFKAEYNEENERLTNAIKNKDEEISKEKTLAQDYQAEAQSYTSAISDIDSQISSMESAMSSLDKNKDSAQISEYNTKINNLKAKKQEYENAKNQAEENEQLANQRIEELEQEKVDLITEKDNILNTLSEKYTDEKDKALALKEEITQYETAKKEIQIELENTINEIDSKIQELKNEKAQIERKNETQKVLDENKVTADTTPIEATGDISTYTLEDWKALGYNETAGNNLGDAALEVGTQMEAAGSKHNCLGGVKRSFIAATGESPFGAPEQGISVASKCMSVMENSDDFKEITGLEVGDLQYLPAGTVIVWTSSSSSGSAADKYGHISISLGDGRESSDNVRAQYRSVGSNGRPRVFIPV